MRAKKVSPSIQYLIGLILICTAAALSSCTAAAPAPAAGNTTVPETSTLTPMQPDAVASTPLPSATPTELVMPTPIPAQPSQVFLPTFGPTPEAGLTQEAETDLYDFGIAAINILRPGQYSRLTSPIRVIANLQTGNDLDVILTLFGEDGRVLANKNIDAKPYDDPLNGNLITDVNFSIPGMVEAGRLELKVIDRYGRLKALNSVNLVLMTNLPDDRNYAPESGERIQLQIPFPSQTEIESNPLLISGLARVQSDHPINIWLVDERGNTVGEAEAAVVRTPGSAYGQFIGEITYEVSAPTRVYMILAISDSRIPGYTYVKAIEMVLLP